MRKTLTFLLILFAVSAQAKRDSVSIRQYEEMLLAYQSKIDSLKQANHQRALNTYDAYKLFSPATFYHSVAANSMSLDENTQSTESREVDNVLMNIYMNHPELVSTSENNLREASVVKESIMDPIKHNVELVEKISPSPQESEEAKVDVVVTKPNFWKIKGDYYLQFLQNYISGNWYKGGESNYAMLASATIEANYDNKEKLKWDNKLEMKLGFQTSRADSIHKLKSSEDLLRLTSNLGLQASKRWYYTLNVLAYTQFMRGYKSNNNMTFSDFMSPFTLNISLGMKYNVEWMNKKLTGNIQLSPFSYNFKYVDRLGLSKRNGIDEGKHVMSDFGSMFTADLTWKFSDNISWKTRLYGFTSFRRAELEWENTFTFKFNKYISSNIFIYPRFDDAAVRDDHHAYWQFKEYASLGFSYSF